MSIRDANPDIADALIQAVAEARRVTSSGVEKGLAVKKGDGWMVAIKRTPDDKQGKYAWTAVYNIMIRLNSTDPAEMSKQTEALNALFNTWGSYTRAPFDPGELRLQTDDVADGGNFIVDEEKQTITSLWVIARRGLC